MTFDPAHLLQHPHRERPPFMLADSLMAETTWGDLERIWLRLASPPNKALVQDLVTALWKDSADLRDEHTLHRVLAATVILGGPAFIPGSEEGPVSET